MFRESMKKSYLLLVIPALLAAIACGGRICLAVSHLPEREIVVDGDAEDWLGALSFLEEEKLSVGFLNDQNNLYVCLIFDKQVGYEPNDEAPSGGNRGSSYLFPKPGQKEINPGHNFIINSLT